MDDAITYPGATPRAAAVVRPVAVSVAKRWMDVVLASVGLVVGAPLLLVIALLVRLDSPGGALFVQERVGLGGRRFRMLKFRTMVVGADPGVHREYVRGLLTGEGDVTSPRGGAPPARGTVESPVFKLVDDPRVTRVGRWLRRTSLDELPQLWNVLVGEMSIVGPRPPLEYEVELYDERQRVRLEARPGITGLWQVSGRNRLSYARMCELDAEYVRGWSLWLDLRILLKTIPVVVTNSGEAR